MATEHTRPGGGEAAPVSGRGASGTERVEVAEGTRTRRYDPAETRLRVLDAATLLFGTRGFDASSTADIARVANVSEGSIFYHFGSKHALLEELAHMHGSRLIVDMEEADHEGDTAIGDVLDRCFEYCDDNNILKKMSKPVVGEKDSQRIEILLFLDAAREMLVSWLAGKIRMKGHRTKGVDPQIASVLIFALVREALHQYVQPGNSEEQRQDIREACIRFSTAVLDPVDGKH